MSTPEFILELRRHVGHARLWLTAVTAVVVRERAPLGRDGADTAGDATTTTELDGRGAKAATRGPGSADGADRTEVLLVRRADTGAWTPVTGIVDPGEHVADAAVREVLEETTVRVRATRLVRVHTLDPTRYVNGDEAQYVDLTFACEWVSGEPYPADGENTEARWFGVGELPGMSDDMFERIEATLDPRSHARFIGGEVPGGG